MSGQLHYTLRVLLVIGFTYWLVLVSILVYLLLLSQRTELDHHLCAWAACTFVLLVIFGAVLVLGLLVVYYLGQAGKLHIFGQLYKTINS